MSSFEKASRPLSATKSPTAAWYILGTVAAIAAGWIGAALNLSHHAPVGILPLGVGLMFGATLTGLAAMTRVNFGKRLLFGTAVLAVVAVQAEHAWLYRDFRRQWHEVRANSPHVAMFRDQTPWSPAEYFRREATPQQLALWCLDAALITTASVGTMSMGRRFLPQFPDTN